MHEVIVTIITTHMVDEIVTPVTVVKRIKFETQHDLELWANRCADNESPLLGDVQYAGHGIRARVEVLAAY
jgi:hypothetical protein